MAVIKNEEGKWVSVNDSFAKKVLDFGVDIFQGIARETLSTGVEVSKHLNKIDDRLTGGFFNFPTELPFESEDTTVGKIQRSIFGEERDSIGGYSEEGEYLSKIYNDAYGRFGLTEEAAQKLGTGTAALFALTNFLPGKKALVKLLVESKDPANIAKTLVKNNVPQDLASTYSPYLARATSQKEVKNILKQIDDTIKATTEVSTKTMRVGSGIVEIPPLTNKEKISNTIKKEANESVQKLVSSKNNTFKIRKNVLDQERERILKQGFKSELQKEQEKFGKKLISTVKKFREVEETLKRKVTTLKTDKKILQEVKNDLFSIVKEYIPDPKISKSLAKKIVEAKANPSQIRKVILAISREKDKIVRKQLLKSINDVVSMSDNFTLLQKERLAATMDNLKLSGMTEETRKTVERMRDYFIKNPERELLLGKKNTELLKRAEELTRKDIKKLSTMELRELERRLSYIKETDALEKRTRKGIEKLQKDIIVDSLSAEAHNLDIKGKIDSIGRTLTNKEKINNFWVSFKEFSRTLEFNYISADNFFDKLGDNFKNIFKYKIDDVYNLAKDRYAKKATELLGKEAELFKKYGTKLSKPNYERIMIYAAKNQKGGLTKLRASGLSDEFINSIKLTDQEMEWYNFTRKELDLIHPKIDDVLRDVSRGEKKLGKIENYFPMNIDADKSEKLIETLFNDSYYKTRGVTKGFTKTRNVFGKSVLKLDARDIYLTYMRKANNFIEMEKTVRQLQSVISDEKLIKAIGKDASRFISDWLDTIARDGLSRHYQRHWIEDLRNNIGGGFLGFKISTILKQPLAKITAGSLLGKHTFAYDVEFIKNKLWETVDNVSLQQRYRAFDDPSYDVSRLNEWQRWGYESIKQTDKITANNVWYAAYRKYFADNKIEFNIEDFKAGRINDEALRFADELTRKTQGSAEIKDISKMFRADDRVIWKILFQFQSFILNQSQLLTVDMKNAIIKEKDPKKAFSILMFFVLTGLGEGYITSGLTGIFGSERAKKEEEERTTGERLADAFFGQIPLINNYIGVTKFGGSGIPLIDTSLDVFTGLDSIFTSEEDKAKLKGATELLSGAASLFGVSGAKQLQQFINAGISSMDDEKTYPTTTRTETLDETDLFNEVKLFDDTKLF